jgi:hypothetical protein
MKIIKIAKFILPNKTYKCGYCSGDLSVTAVNHNPKHFFNPGQHFSCPCGKSQVWANSVRREDDLINYCDNEEAQYNVEEMGFCNDSFCAKCWSGLYPLKTPGFVYNKKAYYYRDAYGEQGLSSIISPEEIDEKINSGEVFYGDVWGCKKCDDNQLLLHQGVGSEGGELDGQKAVAQWFKNNQHMWRKK